MIEGDLLLAFVLVNYVAVEGVVLTSRHMTRSWLRVLEAIFDGILVRPAVGGTLRNVKVVIDPSTKPSIFVNDVVPATLRTEPYPQPVEQRPHFLPGKPFMLLPSGLDGRFEFCFIQLLKFSGCGSRQRALRASVPIMGKQMLSILA